MQTDSRNAGTDSLRAMSGLDTPFDRVVATVRPGTRLRTPDDRTGRPFIVDVVDGEGVLVKTYSGGRVRIGLFTFDTAVKYLDDMGVRGEKWMPVKDDLFQAILNSENDRVRASSYVVAILGAAGVIDVDGSRPNRVRIAG